MSENESHIQKQLKEIVANAATYTRSDQFTNSVRADTAEYAMRWLKVPEGQKLDKWNLLRIEMATLCHTMNQLGIDDAAGLLMNLLKDMERYEKLELEGGFRK